MKGLEEEKKLFAKGYEEEGNMEVIVLWGCCWLGLAWLVGGWLETTVHRKQRVQDSEL